MLGARTAFGGSDVISRGRRKGLCTLSKVSKTWGFCSISKNDGRRGTFEEDLPRWFFRGKRSTRDMFAALRMTWPHFFLAGAVLAKRIGTRPSALHSLSIFEGSLAELFRFWCCQLRKTRKSRSIVSFLMLSSSKIEEVSQNSFVFKLADRHILIQ